MDAQRRQWMPNGNGRWAMVGHGLGMTSPGRIDTLAGLGIIASGHPGVRRRAECREAEVNHGGTLNMEKQGNSPRIRIAWKIGKASGHGSWGSADRCLWMPASIAQLNRKYGPGTHWIEREPQRKPRLHKTLVGDYVCFCETVAGRAWTPEDAYGEWKRAVRRYASEEYWKECFPNEAQ